MRSSITVDATKSQIKIVRHLSSMSLACCGRAPLQSDDAPNVVGGQQDEYQAGKENHRARPLKLAVLAVVEVGHGKFCEEGDGQYHAQGGKYHCVYHVFNLAGGIGPRLLHGAGHIAAATAAGGKSGSAT